MTKTTFVNCNLFVGTEDEVKENAWFTVDDATGKITEVGQGEVKAADKTVDLDGQYCDVRFDQCPHSHWGGSLC